MGKEQKTNDLKDMKDYPEELVKNRSIIEGNIIACLWKNPELYSDFKELTIRDFITYDGRFYYGVGKEILKMGYKAFDIIAINTYLNTNEQIEKIFNNRGGYNAIKHFVDVINIDNIETYYDNLIKNNILLHLHEEGFDVLNNLNIFESLNSEGVYEWIDYRLNNIFMRKQLGLKIDDLTNNFDDFLAICDRGENLGISFASSCPQLSRICGGIHRKNLIITSAHSGVGKTSFCVYGYILALLESGEKVSIIANEQDINEWRSLLLGSIISNKLGYFKMPRQRFQEGKFTEVEWQYIKKAQEWLKKHEGNLKFVQLYDYKINTIKKIVKTLSKRGFGYFVYDTCKAEDLSEDKAWSTFVEQSKQLFLLASKEDVAIIATMQLAMNTLKERYLNGACIGTAKAVKEVCSQLFLMRKLWRDEYTGESKDVKAYRMIIDKTTNKWKKELIDLDKNKEYVIIFVDKNRHGQGDVCLIYQRNLTFNFWHEIGFCTPQQY